MDDEDEFSVVGVHFDLFDLFDPEFVASDKDPEGKCNCGYTGSLLPAVGGFECPSCGYLLIDFSRKGE